MFAMQPLNVLERMAQSGIDGPAQEYPVVDPSNGLDVAIGVVKPENSPLESTYIAISIVQKT